MVGRRKKTETWTLEDLISCSYLNLAVSIDGDPHCIPIRHLLLGKTLYFCREGKNKTKFPLPDDAKVCLCGIVEELQGDVTMLPSFSVIRAYGTVEQVTGPEELRQALFGLHVRHTNSDDKQDAWLFSRNEKWIVYKVTIDRVMGE